MTDPFQLVSMNLQDTINHSPPPEVAKMILNIQERETPMKLVLKGDLKNVEIVFEP